MFARRFRSAVALSLFCTLVTLSSPALAERHTYRDTTEVQVLTERDKPLGEYLASLVSLRRALEQAMPMIREQEFVKKANLNEEQLERLAYALVNTRLSYLSEANSRDPLRITHKTKLDYDTLDFPPSMTGFYLDVVSREWLKVKYERQHAKDTEKKLLEYLQALTNSKDASYQQLLRSAQGAKLFKIYQANQFFQQFLDAMKRKNHDQAMDYLNKAIDEDPDAFIYRMAKASHFLNDHKDYDGALAIYSELINQYPKESDLYTQRAWAYSLQGLSLKSAIDDTKMAVKLNPRNAMAYLVMSLAAKYTHDKALEKLASQKYCEWGTTLTAAECQNP